jgi:hypothetical protein
MMNNIQNFDYENYKSNVEKYLKTFGYISSGNSTKVLVEKIKEIMQEGI